MDSFYFITIIVLFTLFVVSLTIILYMIYTQESKYGGMDASKPYPPVQNPCPDQWTHNATTKLCSIAASSTTSENLRKNLGTLVNANDGSIDTNQFASGSIGFISTLTRSGNTISFNSEDPDFSKSSSLNCGRKNFAGLKGLAWEGVNNYGPC